MLKNVNYNSKYFCIGFEIVGVSYFSFDYRDGAECFPYETTTVKCVQTLRAIRCKRFKRNSE